jgi:hypothetical protein
MDTQASSSSAERLHTGNAGEGLEAMSGSKDSLDQTVNPRVLTLEFIFTLPDERDIIVTAIMESPDRWVGLLDWSGDVTATDLYGNKIELTDHESDLAHYEASQRCLKE